MTPATTLEGTYNAAGLRFGIVCARFNRLYVDQLLAGAMDAIVRHGGDTGAATVAWVPGSYEIPVVAKRLANSGVDADPRALERFEEVAAGGRLGLHFEAGVPVGLGPASACFEDGLGMIAAIVFMARLDGRWPKLKLCHEPDCGNAFFDVAPNLTGNTMSWPRALAGIAVPGLAIQAAILGLRTCLFEEFERFRAPSLRWLVRAWWVRQVRSIAPRMKIPARNGLSAASSPW